MLCLHADSQWLHFEGAVYARGRWIVLTGSDELKPLEKLKLAEFYALVWVRRCDAAGVLDLTGREGEKAIARSGTGIGSSFLNYSEK